MFAVLFVLCIPQLCYRVSSSHCPRLRQSLHAHVQVRIASRSLFTSRGLIHTRSSLITGQTSHKLVKSDVSFILWLYYNDSVRVHHTLTQ